jgi:hypothetical protein
MIDLPSWALRTKGRIRDTRFEGQVKVR